MEYNAVQPALLIMPGMGDSGPEHWQTYLEKKFINLGPHGHINVATGFGRWPQGEELIEELLRPT